jgi:hypothetical protein
MQLCYRLRLVTPTRWLFETVVLAGLLGACGGSGASAPTTQAVPAPGPTATLGKRRADILDDCQQVPGQPEPEPLRIQFTGVAKDARCQREVYTIMGGLTHFLGVECKHCHQEPDYTADTHNKQIANWMARELVPRLQQRAQPGDRAVWCKDCHAGQAKFLGSPRQRSFAIEWMTTHLVEELETTSGKSLKCKQCHQGDLGSPEFKPKIILSELSGLPAPPLPAASGTAAPPAATAPASSTSPAALPIPDFGGR